MKGGVVFLNGRYLPASRALVPALDRGLLYGDGLFETVRTYGGEPFALASHLERMRRGARRIDLRLPGDDAYWRGRIRELLRKNRLGSADVAVRLTITRGVGGDWLLPPERPRLTRLLTLRRLDPSLPRLRRRGVRIVLLPFHPGFGGLLAGMKTTDYLTAIVGKRLARRLDAHEGIYSDRSGQIFEGTTTSLFIVRGRTLLTPPLRLGVLPGVTRRLVMGIGPRAGLAVREHRLYAADLRTADEAFLTATTIEILPVRQVDRRRIGRGVGPLTRRLQELFAALHG